jgi:hypothetical protein
MPAALRFTLVLALIAIAAAVLAVRERAPSHRSHHAPPAALR